MPGTTPVATGAVTTEHRARRIITRAIAAGHRSTITIENKGRTAVRSEPDGEPAQTSKRSPTGATEGGAQ